MNPPKKFSLDRREQPGGSLEERVPTPRSDLIVVRVGPSRARVELRDREKSSSLIGGIARATLKPGIKRTSIFSSRKGKQVYAYSVNPADLTKIIREDRRGKKTIGRFVNGQFKAVRRKTV
jgi:hypothetical protein